MSSKENYVLNMYRVDFVFMFRVVIKFPTVTKVTSHSANKDVADNTMEFHF